MMGFGRSPLRFRHIYAESAKKERWYENIPTSKNAHDGRFIAANPHLLAIAMESTGGGSFLVLPLSRTGRLSGLNPPRVCGHTGPILDLAFHPFDDGIISSASEDTTVKLWRVDTEEGITADLTTPEVELRGHRRRAMYLDWHPSAKDVLMSAGYDHQIIIWNVERNMPFQTLQSHTQVIQSIAWHPQGRLIASTSKDKTLRLLDPRSGAVALSGQGCHMGPKASKVLFLDDDHVFTVGSGRHSDREYCVWSLEKGFSEPLQRQTIDQSSGIILPYFDRDCKVMYLMGKGDGNFRYYEYSEQNVHYLNQHISSVPQRGVGVMPKQGLDMDRCEIFRFYKLHVTANVIEPLSIIAPRRGHFRDDLYPPTAARVPALSSEQWCYHGLNRGPVMVNLQDGSIVNPPAGQPGPAPTQTRPAVPASLRNIGHLAATGEHPPPAKSPSAPSQRSLPPSQAGDGLPSSQSLSAPPQRKSQASPQPPSVSPQPQTMSYESQSKNYQSQAIAQQPQMGYQQQNPTAPSQNGHHHVTLNKSPQPVRAVQRSRMSASDRRHSARFTSDLGSQPDHSIATSALPARRSSTSDSDLAPPDRLEPAKSPCEADHVPSFKSLVQAFEHPPSEEPSGFSRSQRRAQSMRERSRKPLDQSATAPTVSTSATVSVTSTASTAASRARPRYIRRPESLQSPEEQRKSIQLSLQARSAAQAPASSSRTIDMKPPRQITIPETYEELREAFLEQQSEIRNLRFELERRDRDLERLRTQLVAKNKAFKAAPVPSQDSSFC